MKSLQEVMMKLRKLEKEKADKVEMLISQARPRKLIPDHIRNETVLMLVSELREIEDQIEEIYSMSVESK